MTCASWTHDFAPDPPARPNWRESTTTCTRCGEVRNALSGLTIKEAS